MWWCLQYRNILHIQKSQYPDYKIQFWNWSSEWVDVPCSRCRGGLTVPCIWYAAMYVGWEVRSGCLSHSHSTSVVQLACLESPWTLALLRWYPFWVLPRWWMVPKVFSLFVLYTSTGSSAFVYAGNWWVVLTSRLVYSAYYVQIKAAIILLLSLPVVFHWRSLLVPWCHV